MIFLVGITENPLINIFVKGFCWSCHDFVNLIMNINGIIKWNDKSQNITILSLGRCTFPESYYNEQHKIEKKKKKKKISSPNAIIEK